MVLHQHVIDSLRELSNVEYQKRVWLGNGQMRANGFREQSDLMEAGCHLFIDSGLGDALTTGGVIYSTTTDDDLRRLRLKIESLYMKINTLADIQSSSMNEVRADAARVLSSLENTQCS